MPIRLRAGPGQIAARVGLEREHVDRVFEGIRAFLAEGREVWISEFGRFTPKYLPTKRSSYRVVFVESRYLKAALKAAREGG